MKILFAAVLTASVALSATPASATSISIAACYTSACGSLTGQVNVPITDDDGTNVNPGTGDLKGRDCEQHEWVR